MICVTINDDSDTQKKNNELLWTSSVSGLRGSGIRFSLILGVVIVRYIVLPLVGILVVKGAINLGLLHQDPLYHFILLLQYALPPAMNIGERHLPGSRGI